MLAAGTPRGIGHEVCLIDGRPAALARVVGAGAQTLQRQVDVIENLRGLRQVGFIALFHRGRVPRGTPAGVSWARCGAQTL